MYYIPCFDVISNLFSLSIFHLYTALIIIVFCAIVLCTQLKLNLLLCSTRHANLTETKPNKDNIN